MTETPIECPECGRSFPAASNLQGHVNASNDHPSWAAIRAQLDGGEHDQGDDGLESGDSGPLERFPEGPGEGPSKGDSEGGTSPSEEPTNKETGEEGPEPGDGRESKADSEGPQEGPEEAPYEEDMPTEEEIERQRAQYQGGSEGGSSPSDPETNDEGAEPGDGGPSKGASQGPDEGAQGPLPGAVEALVPSVDKTTLALLVGLALVLLLLYRYMGDDESGTSQETESVQAIAEEDVDDQESADVPAGEAGLVATGVQG